MVEDHRVHNDDSKMPCGHKILAERRRLEQLYDNTAITATLYGQRRCSFIMHEPQAMWVSVGCVKRRGSFAKLSEFVLVRRHTLKHGTNSEDTPACKAYA